MPLNQPTYQITVHNLVEHIADSIADTETRLSAIESILGTIGSGGGSTNGDSIPPYDRITDPVDTDTFWTVVSGVAKLDGVTVGTNFNVALLLKFPYDPDDATVGSMYHANTSGQWFKLAADNTTWVSQSGDPRLSSFGGFSVTNPPPATFRPFSSNSPANTPIEAGFTVEATGGATSADRIATHVSEAGGSSSWPSNMLYAVPNGFDHPRYWAQQGDNVYTIISSLVTAIVGLQVKVPSFAQAAGGSDGHMHVITPDGQAFNLFDVTINHSTHEIASTYGGRMRYDGPGVVTPQSLTDGSIIGTGGGTAGAWDLDFGMIGGAELAAGNINHALFCTIKTLTRSTASTVATLRAATYYISTTSLGSFSLPAIKPDASSATSPRVWMGARLKLDMTVADIDATPAQGWEKTIAKAAATHGIYVGDTGGAGFQMMFESNLPYALAGVRAPMMDVVDQYGISFDPVYGYGFIPYRDAGRIDWINNLKVINGPPEI